MQVGSKEPVDSMLLTEHEFGNLLIEYEVPSEFNFLEYLQKFDVKTKCGSEVRALFCSVDVEIDQEMEEFVASKNILLVRVASNKCPLNGYHLGFQDRFMESVYKNVFKEPVGLNKTVHKSVEDLLVACIHEALGVSDENDTKNNSEAAQLREKLRE